MFKLSLHPDADDAGNDHLHLIGDSELSAQIYRAVWLNKTFILKKEDEVEFLLQKNHEQSSVSSELGATREIRLLIKNTIWFISLKLIPNRQTQFMCQRVCTTQKNPVYTFPSLFLQSHHCNNCTDIFTECEKSCSSGISHFRQFDLNACLDC